MSARACSRPGSQACGRAIEGGEKGCAKSSGPACSRERSRSQGSAGCARVPEQSGRTSWSELTRGGRDKGSWLAGGGRGEGLRGAAGLQVDRQEERDATRRERCGELDEARKGRRRRQGEAAAALARSSQLDPSSHLVSSSPHPSGPARAHRRCPHAASRPPCTTREPSERAARLAALPLPRTAPA